MSSLQYHDSAINLTENLTSWIERDSRVLWHGFTQMSCYESSTPVIVDRGEGNYLIDVDGKRYLDAISSLWVTTLGHNDPQLNQAVIEQLTKISHSTLLGNGNIAAIQLAESLATLVPVADPHFLFASDGASAVEQALKIAFQHWHNLGVEGRDSYLSLDSAYHGDTIGSLSLGAGGFGTNLFDSLRFPVTRTSGYDSSDWAERAIETIKASHERLAAFVLEPLVQGAAGIQVAEVEDVRAVVETAQNYGVLVICDEVATGFGRTGTLFACERCDIRPDILCIGKGITGGYMALSATVVAKHVYESFLGQDLGSKTFYHGHSYSGNALACALATKHLELFFERKILSNVEAAADALSQVLQTVSDLSGVKAVRQRGLMAGVELDPAVISDDLRGRQVCAEAVRNGVLLRPLGDVVVIVPPLSILESEVQQIGDVFSTALQTVVEQ